MNHDVTIRDAGILYIEKCGYAVFPLRGKVPFKKLNPEDKGGFYEAVKTVEEWDALLRKYPGGDGIGIATGAVSGVWALDKDVKTNATGPAGGDETLDALERQHGKLPEGPLALTPSKGSHYVFNYPTGGVDCGAGRIGKGLDHRGDGGYIAAWPTPGYYWEVEPWSSATPEAPAWLLTASRTKRKDLDLIKDDAKITENRNDTLTSIAGNFRRNGLEPQDLFIALSNINHRRCLPPLPDDEVRKIANSIGKKPVVLPHVAYTDMWGANILKDLFTGDIHWSGQLGGWVIWGGTRWKQDETFQIMRMADSAIKRMHDMASHSGEKKMAAFAVSREKLSQKEAMIKTMKGLEGIALGGDVFDSDTHLLNCPNGTYDLKEGILRPHSRADMITRQIDVPYTPGALCPRWDKFMLEIFDGDTALVDYVQRGVGYSLSGDVSEHVMFVLYGTGKNGKSTFINTISAVLGDYSLNARPTLLIEKKYDSGGGATGDIARLRGARFVSVLESNRNSSFDEAQVKALTGNDEITARFLYREEFQFIPTHKIWFSTNHKPEILGTDDGIWRRVPTVPFNHFFSDAEVDKQLCEKLAKECEGILNWAIKGYQLWTKEGLGRNPSVELATEAYKDDSDVLKNFIEEMCTIDALGWCLVQDVKEAFTEWRKSTGARFFKPNEIAAYFSQKLDLEKRKVSMDDGRWCWPGIVLKNIGHKNWSLNEKGTLEASNEGNKRPY